MRPSRPVVLHTLLETRGGAARVADVLAAELAREGCPVVRTFELAETRAGEAALAAGGGLPRLLALARDGATIHLHGSARWPELLAELAAAAPGRVVLTLHDAALTTGGCAYPLDCPRLAAGCADCPRSYPGAAARRTALAAALHRLAPRLVSPSRWLKDVFAAALPGLAVRVVPNGVPWPEALPDKAAARAALGLAPAARTVLFAAHGGEEAAYKAGGSWQAIFSAIKAHVPAAVGFFAGGREQGRTGDVVRLPYLDQASLGRLLAAADVLAYPTLADNHPLIVLEAMAAGTPAVAYAVGGLPEEIEDGRTGRLVAPGDTAGFVAAVAQLAARPAAAARLGSAAWQNGRARFSAGRMAADYRKIYESLEKEEA